MPKHSPRERAARALCRHAGHPENIKFGDRPMWQSYLEEVDIVLRAALTPDEFVRLLKEDPDWQPDRER